MATGTIMKTRKSKIYHQTVTNKAINTAWGSGMYISTVSIPISISGTVLGALVSFRGNGNSAIASLDSVTTQNASVLLARGNSASVSGTITLEVFYE